MKNPKLIVKPFAKNGQKNVIPENYETSMESNQATWDQGFGQITMLPVAAGGLPPKGQDFNGILNQISENIVYLSQGGRFKFSSEYAEAIGGYPKGAILQSDDEKKEYLSLIDNNKVDFNTATDISASWKLVNTDDLLAQIASKQQKGDYATKAELNSGLAGKQPTGDYATKTDVGLKLDKSAVVQATGTSTTNVMSQKSVTDALANALKDYLNLTGGTLTGPLFIRKDGPAFVISPTTEDGACYVQGRDHNNKAVWFIGNPTDGGTAIYFRNYITGAEVSLHANGISLNQNTYINGTLELTNYSTFDARYSKIRTVLKSDNGYEKDENTGLIRQWGKTPAFGAGNGSPVKFPIPFPSKCVGVSALPIRDSASSAGSAETIYCGAPGLSGVQLYLGGTINYPVYWEAWGY